MKCSRRLNIMNNVVRWLDERKGRKKAYEEELEKLNIQLEEASKVVDETNKAKGVFVGFMQSKQDQIVDACTDLGTLMLRAIYGDEYKLVLSFEVKRGKSDASLKVFKGNMELSLDEETGGGIVDVAALAMRFALWSLMEPRTSPVFVLDEPARFISKDKLPLMGEILAELSEKLEIQLIMVSHEEELIGIADKSYRVGIEDGVSMVGGG